tara:strand:+ start:249 stop:443 length:195 start_codon:yes stop_codon:yes gene_type:complete
MSIKKSIVNVGVMCCPPSPRLPTTQQKSNRLAQPHLDFIVSHSDFLGFYLYLPDQHTISYVILS